MLSRFHMRISHMNALQGGRKLQPIASAGVYARFRGHLFTGGGYLKYT